MSHPRRHKTIWKTGDSPIKDKDRKVEHEAVSTRLRIGKKRIFGWTFEELLERARRAVKRKKSLYDENLEKE